MNKVLFTILLFLIGCGASSDQSVSLADFNSLKAQVVTLQTQMSKLQFEGKLNTVVVAHGVLTRAITQAVSFGTCPDMGLFQGRGGSDTPDTISSQFETYKQCTGYFYTISDFTGVLDVPPFVAWDQPNCQGTAYIETDVPQNTINSQVLKGGYVFQSPANPSITYAVTAGQTPQPVMIQSALNTRGGVCGADVETRTVVSAVVNNSAITGVPNSLVPGTWTNGVP